MQNPTFSLISGGLYCNSNVNSETITYAANLCGNMWQLGEGFLVPLKCAVVVYTGMPKKNSGYDSVNPWGIYFHFVVAKTSNNHKQPQTTTNQHKLPENDHETSANDHKPPANNHQRPNKPFPNSIFFFFFCKLETRRSLKDVNKHRCITSLCS